jgi:hypothetical protein
MLTALDELGDERWRLIAVQLQAAKESAADGGIEFCRTRIHHDGDEVMMRGGFGEMLLGLSEWEVALRLRPEIDAHGIGSEVKDERHLLWVFEAADFDA